MHGIPDIVSITLYVLGQSGGHRRGAWPTLLAQASIGQHKVVEVDYQPDPRAVSTRTRGTAAGAPAQRGTQAPHGAIPTLHERRLDGRPKPPTGHLLHEPSGAAIHHASDDPQELARAIAHLHHLTIEQFVRRAQAGLRVA